MKQGDLVIVRAYGDEPLVRRLWEADKWAVYIATEENYEKLVVNNRDAMNAVGFPMEDVFVYSPEAAERILAEWENNPAAWQSMTPWTAMS